MNQTSRPLVQDLVKQAMANASHRAQIASEGARQMKLAEKDCKKCDKDPCECKDKTASADSGSVSTDYAMKLAAALEYAGPTLVEMTKKANSAAVALPEGVSHSDVSGKPVEPGSQGHGHQQPPMNPGVQKAHPQEHAATQMENTKDSPTPGTQTTAMSGGKGKTAEALEESNLKVASNLSKAKGLGRVGQLLTGSREKALVAHANGLGHAGGHFLSGDARKQIMKGALEESVKVKGTQMGAAGLATTAGLGVLAHGGKKKDEPKDKPKDKKASAPETMVDYFLSKVKEAEDAINPAQISAGPAEAPDTSAAGEAGGAPVGGAPQGPTGLIASNEAAINYKKQESHGPRKTELAQYFNEPALSAATDKTLAQSFAHTGEAGVKISAAQLVKAASARALLAKLAEQGANTTNSDR